MSLKRVTGRSYRDTDSTVTTFNTSFKTFKRVVVSRSIDNVCGEFSITLTRPVDNSTPFKVGEVLDIKIDNTQVMRGKIYSIDPEGDAGDDVIIISGRDITGDLIDSTVPDDSKVYTDGARLFDIAGSIIRSKGMDKVLTAVNGTGAEIDPFTTTEIISCEIGDTVVEFLFKYCRKRQVFLNTTVNGNLLFFRANGRETGNRVINLLSDNENNVISYKAKFNLAQRFYKYICKTQSSEAWTSGAVDSQGEALDTGVSNFRELEFKLEEGFNGASECKARAIEEANVRRARAFEYSATVQGFKDKVMWGINQFVTVHDDRSGVHGKFLIKGVEYVIDNRKGSTTRLTIVDQDAYTAEAAISARAKGESNRQWYNELTDTLPTPDNLRVILEDGN